MAREEPIKPLPVEGAPHERDHGTESPKPDVDQGPTPVVWLPPDEE
jgi:hypothetical protein